MKPTIVSRRIFLETLLLGSTVGAAGAFGSLGVRTAMADEPQKLDVKDPAAAAVGYVEKASQVNPKKYPAYVEGSNCANCLQLQGKPGNDYRPCGLFAGKLVAVSGWCSGWTAEM